MKKPKTVMPWPVFKYASPTKASSMLTADQVETLRTEFYEGSVKENGAYSLGSIETLESIETIDDIIDVQPDNLETLESIESIDSIINVQTDDIKAIEAIDKIVNIVQPDSIDSIVNIQTNKSIKPIGGIRKLSDNPLHRDD
jgi:hypothetical protein